MSKIINRPTCFNHIFGPVPSRRLGKSLGIDLIPFKTCSLDCIYCECGKTLYQTCVRSEYISAGAITDELDCFLESAPLIDFITITGSGEPTLNTAIDKVIKHIKKHYPEYKTAILTNSTLLHLKEVRQSIMAIDYVLPSLDAASQQVFEKINKPSPTVTCDSIIEGLSDFAQEYNGILWVELFIVTGINDTKKELCLIKKVLENINPSRVQINSLDRPGVYDWVKPASFEQLSRIAKYLTPLPIEIVKREGSRINANSVKFKNIEMIYEILKRRPMTVEDIAISLNININDVNAILERLIDKKKIHTNIAGNKTFYRVIDKLLKNNG